MRPLTKRLIAVLFPILLLLPSLSILLPAAETEIENRPVEFPQFDRESILDPAFYRAGLAYVRDANPVRAILIRIGAGLDFWVFDDSPNPNRVFKGEDDWLYFRDTVQRACATSPEEVAKNLEAFVDRMGEDVETVVLTVAPSKFAIHPEHLTDEQFQLTQCARMSSAELRALLARSSFDHYVDSWALLTAMKSTGAPPYFRTDTHFTYEASIEWMKSLIDEIAPVWDDSAVENLGPIDFDGNLMAFIALRIPERVDHFVIQRDVIQVAEVLQGRATRYRMTDSNDLGDIPGEALVIGDSFMVIPEPSLVQYFADVTVFDWRQEQAVASFLQRAPQADVVVVEVSELDIWDLFGDQRFLDQYVGEQ